MTVDIPRNASARTETVAAVVVTYNRKILLARCLDAVLAQTRPVDRVILVDNCSTDGTPELLESGGYLRNRSVEYVRLPENTGGAGGFHEGMKRAHELGYDWLWMMDDDGMPVTDTLEMLLKCVPRILFRGCLVINMDDPTGDELAFCLSGPRGTVHKISELRCTEEYGLWEEFANPFNGVLISREVVERIGLPKKELFIWGDEKEYLLRAKKLCIPIGTVLGAKFLHPPPRALAKRIRLGPLSFTLPYSEDRFRFYLIVRNNTYTSLRHYGPFHRKFLKLATYPFVFPLQTGLIFRAWFEGITGRLALAFQKRA